MFHVIHTVYRQVKVENVSAVTQIVILRHELFHPALITGHPRVNAVVPFGATASETEAGDCRKVESALIAGHPADHGSAGVALTGVLVTVSGGRAHGADVMRFSE